MSFSTDAEILAMKQEFQEVVDSAELSGNDNWKIRLRDGFQRIADDLQAIHETDGEPDATPLFRQAQATVTIAVGYTWNAVALQTKAIASSDPVDSLDARNQFWQALSYSQTGLAQLLAALEEQ
jgi:hypothetical protein